MNQSNRVGDFTVLTPVVLLGFGGAIVLTVVVGWCWKLSLETPPGMSLAATIGVTVFAVPLALVLIYAAASNFITWVAVGEEFRFATLLRSYVIPWDEVREVELLFEHRSVSLSPLPASVPLGVICTAVITLENGRVLQGGVKHKEVIHFYDVLEQHPRLDAAFGRALESPRETMKTFVEAVMENRGSYAAKVLDFSRIGEQPTPNRSHRCAAKLKEVIDHIWFIDYEEIPDDPDADSPYVIGTGSDQQIDDAYLPLVGAIKISRDEASGHWRFDAETVEMIVNEFLKASEDDETREP